MCAVLLILHLNISANMPVSSTSARPGIRSSLSLPVQTKHFIWHSTPRLENLLDSSAVPPAAIGLVMADLAVKSSPVEVIKYMTPDQGTSHSNEVIVAVTGDADAVKNAVLTARDVGLQLLVSMGSYPESPATPYLQ